MKGKPLPEDEVYIGCKELLRVDGWQVLAGQPPNGCDHLPVVEIKAPWRTQKGSLAAYKPDLLAAREGIFLIIECKPRLDTGDVAKLREILAEPGRVESLYSEIRQRRLLERRQLTASFSEFRNGICGAVAHSGPPMSLPDLWVVIVRSMDGVGQILPPTKRTYSQGRSHA